MARSKIKGTSGKPVKKGSNRDKLKASIHIETGSHNQYGKQQTKQTTIKRYNDGDPHVYHTDKRSSINNSGTSGTTTKRKVKVKEAANPISKGVKGVKGLPAISRDKHNMNEKYSQVKAHLDKRSKKNGGTDTTTTKSGSYKFPTPKKKKK